MGKYNKKMKEIETTNTREHLGEWSIINRDEEKVNELRDIARQLLDGKNPVETTNSEIAKALQAEKEFSQNYLKENGIEGITVYRGVDKNSANQILQQIKDKGFAEVKLNSLSSFTTSKKVANDYVKYNERDSRGGLSFKTNINTSETWMNYHSSPYLWSQTHEKEVVVGTNRIIVIKPEDIIEVSKLSKKSITNKEIVLDNNLFDDQWLHTLRVRNNIKVYKIRKYGTSSGALAAWDTRGRGQKEETEKPKETPKSQIVYKPIDSDNMEERIGSQKQVEGIKNMISNLPEEHTKGIQAITVKTKDQVYDWAIANGESQIAAVMVSVGSLAIINPAKGEIIINFPVVAKGSTPITDIIVHEVGHKFLNNTFGEKVTPDFLNKFSTSARLDILNTLNDSNLIGNEITGAWDENFAGMYRMYINHSEHMKAQEPNVYAFMKDNVFKGKEFSKETKNLNFKNISRQMIYEYKFKDGTKVYSAEPIEFPKDKLIPNKKIKIVIRRKGTNAKR